MGPWILEHILTLIVASPLVGVLMLIITPKRHDEAARNITLSISCVTFFISLVMLSLFSPVGRFAFVDSYYYYAVAVDGLGAFMLAVVSFVAGFSVLISWQRKDLRREFFALLLLAEVGFLGVFASVDILAMLIFIEFAVASLGGLIFISGSSSRDVSRYIGFMGAAALLLMVVVIFLSVAGGSTDLGVIEKVVLEKKFMTWGLFMLLASVGILMGIFPFNSWRGEIKKGELQPFLSLMGLAGGFIFYRLFPSFIYAVTNFRTPLLVALITIIIISSMIAFAKKSMVSQLIAVTEVYFCFYLLGLVSVTHEGIAGSGMQMVAISMITTLVGVFVSRLKDEEMTLSKNPVMGSVFFVIAVSLMTMPGFIMFPGLFMLWMGLFKGTYIFALLSLAGLMISSASLIGPLTHVLKRESEEADKPLFDKHTLLLSAPLILIVVCFGVFPDLVLHFVGQSTEGLWKLIMSL